MVNAINGRQLEYLLLTYKCHVSSRSHDSIWKGKIPSAYLAYCVRGAGLQPTFSHVVGRKLRALGVRRLQHLSTADLFLVDFNSVTVLHFQLLK